MLELPKIDVNDEKRFKVYTALFEVAMKQRKESNDPVSVGACLMSLGYFMFRDLGHSHEQVQWMQQEISEQSIAAESSMQKETVH